MKLTNIINNFNIDGLILTDGYNIHYLTGYKGHTGCLLAIKDKRYILTDSRYTEQVSIEAPEYVCVDVGLDGYSKTISKLILDVYTGQSNKDYESIRIGFENEHISYKQYKAFLNQFEMDFKGKLELVELAESINNLRMVKTLSEQEKIARAEAIGDEAFKHILSVIRPGISEKAVAMELEYTMRSLGAEGLSFDTIAASGPNSSLPHAVPSDRIIAEGDFLTMDFGCIYEGYCSDMTRTVFIGSNPSEKQLEVYNVVLQAQIEAMKLIKPGVKCSDVDACARNIIADKGYGEYFGHGLGHSVGLFIHEEPRFSRKCDTILEEGMVLTVEPGIYLPGEFGVRIEDVIVVTADGYRNLTTSPNELICL